MISPRLRAALLAMATEKEDVPVINALARVVEAAETTSGLHEVFFKGKTCSCAICETLRMLEAALKGVGA